MSARSALPLLAALLLALPLERAAAQDDSDLGLGGGIYLFHHAPVDLPGAYATTEVYALFLDLDRRSGPWRVRIQGRWRDTKLRPFFPSNVWLQEAWVSWTRHLGARSAARAVRGSGAGAGGKRAADGEPGADRRGSEDAAGRLTLRAGKVYQRLGRFWDGSFFGNVHYFDGIKLDPEFGVEAVGSLPLGPGGGAELLLHGQYLLSGDRVNGALAGRDVEGLPGAEEEDGFAAGLRVRAPLGRPGGRPLAAAAGISGLAERGELRLGPGGVPDADAPARDVALDHVAADAELAWGGLLLYAEWSDRSARGFGPAAGTVPGSDAEYWLVGAELSAGRLALRYNHSRARYRDAGFRDRIHQPGLALTMGPGVSLLIEYDDWERSGGAPETIDRSLSAVLLLEF